MEEKKETDRIYYWRKQLIDLQPLDVGLYGRQRLLDVVQVHVQGAEGLQNMLLGEIMKN